MLHIQSSFRITPDNLLKLRLLSIALQKSHSKLISSLIEKAWEENKDLAVKISKSVVTGTTKKVIEQMRKQ